MSFRLFQVVIEQMKSVVGYEFGIIDSNGVIVLSSNEKREGKDVYSIYADLMKEENKEFIEKDGYIYQKVFLKNKFEFIAYIENVTQDAKKILELVSMNIKNTKFYYDEKYNKINFVRSIITDNILMGDITARARELRIKNEVLRKVFVVNVEKQTDMHVYEILCNLFPNKTREFVVDIDDGNIAVIKELTNEDDEEEVKRIGASIINTISTELMEKARVGLSTTVHNIKDINRAYKEAQMAVVIGSIFEPEKQIISYSKLGIGRLIYQLPKTLCKLFLDEVFKDGTFELLDAETVVTIQKFFENNLNVSETARQLFIHRNTLVYRLDKIQKLTGLDLRMFDDAIIFKVAMLVKNYLEQSDTILR